jgi:hypothetical protein
MGGYYKGNASRGEAVYPSTAAVVLIAIFAHHTDQLVCSVTRSMQGFFVR